jgi:hypothetical protein
MPATLLSLALLALVSTSCFGKRVTTHDRLQVIKPGGHLNVVAQTADLGDVFFAQPVPQYLFERAKPPTRIQDASVDLIKVVPPHKDLHLFALSSTRDTAALLVLEVSLHKRWGRLMIPAERRIIRAFAADSSLGRWLILLTDVDVRGEPDPIPLTAYRWTRSDVERFKQCGIPASQMNDCTDAFYLAARTVIVSSVVHIPGQ